MSTTQIRQPNLDSSKSSQLDLKRAVSKLFKSKDARGYWILIVMFVVGAIVAPAMLDAGTIRALIANSGPLIFASVGEAAVLMVGELDLSIGAIMALSGVVVVTLMNNGISTEAAIIIAVLSGLIVGLVNGFCTAIFGISSFIVTLGSSFAVYGVSLAMSNGVVESATHVKVTIWLSSFIASVVSPILVLVVIVVVAASFLVGSTTWGRRLYAVGGDRESATRWGFPVRRVLLQVFMLSGAVSALGGVVLALSLGTGNPNAGTSILLTTIAGVVIGGIALSGGEGRVGAACAGTVALVVLEFVLNQRNVGSAGEQFVAGIVVVIVGLKKFDNIFAFKGRSLASVSRDRRDHKTVEPEGGS